MKSKIFIYTNVKSQEKFESAIRLIVKANEISTSSTSNRDWSSGVFSCYVSGRTFTVASAKRVHNFRFPTIFGERQFVEFIAVAIEILKKNVPKDYLLVDTYSEAISLLR